MGCWRSYTQVSHRRSRLETVQLRGTLMQVRPRLALIVSALILGACGTETPTRPPAAP